jgi:4-hydroxy-tetrahydrodipicolinate reductase
MSALKIGVAGALGHMGHAVAKAVREATGAEPCALFDRPGTAGQAVDGRLLCSVAEAVEACEVVIDFSVPEASVTLAEACADHKGPALVIGSTGLSPEAEARIAKAAKRIAIVKSASFSLGVNMLMGRVEQTARALGPDAWDIEVFEAHHRRKVDAPSGTALMLGAAAARGRGVDLAKVAERVRDGVGDPRAPGAIGFSVMRGGGIVGEHSVSFVADDEILTLSHSARDRSMFAKGALAAALWVADKPPGLYDMLDVLGFRGEQP